MVLMEMCVLISGDGFTGLMTDKFMELCGTLFKIEMGKKMFLVSQILSESFTLCRSSLRSTDMIGVPLWYLILLLLLSTSSVFYDSFIWNIISIAAGTLDHCPIASRIPSFFEVRELCHAFPCFLTFLFNF